MGIVRDWIALPFVLLGAVFYMIGEKISGKKFTYRSDMAILENTASLNRRERRANRAQRRRR